MDSRQKQSGIARKLLKLALSAANINVPESTLALPGINLIQSVREQSDIGISITHCPEMVAVAIGRNKIGLDCEALGRRRNWQGIADQFFTEREADAIRQALSEDTEHVFLQYWTLKEAFIKANKKSIFGELNHLTIRSETEVQLQRNEGNHWQVWRATADNCILGICCHGGRTINPVFVECTNLSSGSFIAFQENISIISMSTSHP